MITGFRAALASGADIVVKIDGDGQMDPRLIAKLCAPIIAGIADYAKGNRFYNIEDVKSMPKIRLFGNIILSFLTKLSSGYWSLFDPNNGFIAIDGRVLANIPLEKVSRRYFFESDMLFRLGTLRARVVDMPMRAIYGGETSGLRPFGMVLHFLHRHLLNLCKRVFYSYFLRDFSIASLQLVVGAIFVCFGLIFGSVKWIENSREDVVTPTGTVMLAVLPLLLGVQFLLAFISFDMANTPSEPIAYLLNDPSFVVSGKSSDETDFRDTDRGQ
jgi:glycosyltransferase involved in cell wall biosynthesis